MSLVFEFNESLERFQRELSYRKNGLECVNDMPMRTYGLIVYFRLQNDANCGEPHVAIYRIVVDFEYFGLVNPNTYRNHIQEAKNRIILKESQLRSIIRETIKRILISA